MKYRRYVSSVETVYAYSDIDRSMYTGSGYDPATDRSRARDFAFLYRDGHTVTHPGMPDWSYGSFHGLTISVDGTKFFLQGWENGIRCYDVTNGRLLWKNRIRRTRNLLVSENSLVAVTGDRKLIAMSVDTGLVTAERTGFRQVIDVTEKLCMAADREKRCFLVDKDTLETRLALPVKLHDCTIDILPAGKKLYALTEMLADTVPREPVYRLHELPLPETADPALWESRYTMRRWEILQEIYSLSADEITEEKSNA